MNQLSDRLQAALEGNLILETTAQNCGQVYTSPETSEWERQAIEPIGGSQCLGGMNDRFYKALAFGTGGIRGRTIGKVVTTAERGIPSALGAPEHPAVGTNMMNRTNVRRAAMGLGEHVLQAFPGQPCRVVIAHDTRHFSADFTKICAEGLQSQGIDVFVFPEERSTRKLSFSVRWLQAQAGIVISASHNRPMTMGSKLILRMVASLVEPHASGVIAQVNGLASGKKPTVAKNPGKLTILGDEADQAFLAAVRTLVLEPEIIAQSHSSLK